MMTRSWV